MAHYLSAQPQLETLVQSRLKSGYILLRATMHVVDIARVKGLRYYNIPRQTKFRCNLRMVSLTLFGRIAVHIYAKTDCVGLRVRSEEWNTRCPVRVLGRET